MPKPMYVWSGSAWVSVATEVESLATYATQSYADSQPGMKLIVPSSVSVGSGSGSVSTQGAVTFSGASSVSINSCFSSSYRNYKIIVNFTARSADMSVQMRMRTGTTDNSNASYGRSGIEFVDNATTLTALNSAGQTAWTLATLQNASYADFTNISMDLYNPQVTNKTLATFQASQLNSVGAGRVSTIYFDATTSFDGFSLIASTGNFDGIVRIYGYKNG